MAGNRLSSSIRSIWNLACEAFSPDDARFGIIRAEDPEPGAPGNVDYDKPAADAPVTRIAQPAFALSSATTGLVPAVLFIGFDDKPQFGDAAIAAVDGAGAAAFGAIRIGKTASEPVSPPREKPDLVDVTTIPHPPARWIGFDEQPVGADRETRSRAGRMPDNRIHAAAIESWRHRDGSRKLPGIASHGGKKGSVARTGRALWTAPANPPGFASATRHHYVPSALRDVRHRPSANTDIKAATPASAAAAQLQAWSSWKPRGAAGGRRPLRLRSFVALILCGCVGMTTPFGSAESVKAAPAPVPLFTPAQMELPVVKVPRITVWRGQHPETMEIFGRGDNARGFFPATGEFGNISQLLPNGARIEGPTGTPFAGRGIYLHNPNGRGGHFQKSFNRINVETSNRAQLNTRTYAYSNVRVKVSVQVAERVRARVAVATSQAEALNIIELAAIQAGPGVSFGDVYYVSSGSIPVAAAAPPPPPPAPRAVAAARKPHPRHYASRHHYHRIHVAATHCCCCCCCGPQQHHG